MTAKRTVEYKGTVYKVKSDTVEIPDLAALDPLHAAIWINQNTYARGRGMRTKPNPLAGLGEAITLDVR